MQQWQQSSAKINWLWVVLLHAGLWYAFMPALGAKKSVSQTSRYLEIFNIPEVQPTPRLLPHSLPQTVPIPSSTRTTRSKPSQTNRASSIAPAPESISETIHTDPFTPSTPNLDLDALKKSALALNKAHRPSTIEQIQNDLKRPEKDVLAEGIKQAKAKECLKSYAGAGLLAPIPFVWDQLKGKSCTW